MRKTGLLTQQLSVSSSQMIILLTKLNLPSCRGPASSLGLQTVDIDIYLSSSLSEENALFKCISSFQFAGVR